MKELRDEIQNASGSRVMHLLRVLADKQLTRKEMLRARENDHSQKGKCGYHS